MPGQRRTNTDLTPEERLRALLRVELAQEGGDPSRILTSLAAAVEQRVWERLGLPDFATFVASEKGLGARPGDILTIAKLHHRYEEHDPETRQRMQRLRREIDEGLHPSLADHGRHDIIMSPEASFGTSRSYILRRLQRDRKDLARRVLAGEMSANAAAREAGFGKPRTTVRTDDPAKIAPVLAKHFDRRALRAIAAHLLRLAGEDAP